MRMLRRTPSGPWASSFCVSFCAFNFQSADYLNSMSYLNEAVVIKSRQLSQIPLQTADGCTHAKCSTKRGTNSSNNSKINT